jgi:hypothetical protein
MGSRRLDVTTDDRSLRAGLRQKASSLLRGLLEAGVLAMVCLSPWAFGAVGEPFQFALYAAVAVLLCLSGVRILIEGELSWKKCPVGLVLAALVLYGAWQLTPLPHRLLSWLSPATVRLCEQLIPTKAEVLPFGETREPPLSAGSTISLYPGRTWHELMKLLAVCFASAASLRRLAIASLLGRPVGFCQGPASSRFSGSSGARGSGVCPPASRTCADAVGAWSLPESCIKRSACANHVLNYSSFSHKTRPKRCPRTLNRSGTQDGGEHVRKLGIR